MKGMKIGTMHSDLTQQERDTIMRDFRNHHINVLIATDIVSRGIDIDDIQMVINYDTPNEAEDYVHRIGRTARANRDGQAITLVTPDNAEKLFRIEKLIEKEIDKPDLPEGCGEKPQLIKKSRNNRRHYHSVRKDIHRHESTDNRHREHRNKNRDIPKQSHNRSNHRTGNRNK